MNKLTFYITGDCHGDFRKIEFFCRHHETSIDDVMIVLGDAGINFWLDRNDERLKGVLAELPLTFFSIHGNHEQRPYLLESYAEKEWNGGSVYYEKEYPNLLFAKDGEVYDLAGKKTIVLGGAYSIDKEYRLTRGYPWYESELPSDDIKEYVAAQLDKINWKVDYVFSHTCPLQFEPRDMFIPDIDQSRVDKTTEKWLTEIEHKLNYEKWYFAHFHGNRVNGKVEMLYEVIKELGGDDFVQRVGIPQFRRNQEVGFRLDKGEEKVELCGRISIIDAYGTWGQSKEVSYDIFGKDNVLYKHIPESDVFAIEGKMTGSEDT